MSNWFDVLTGTELLSAGWSGMGDLVAAERVGVTSTEAPIFEEIPGS